MITICLVYFRSLTLANLAAALYSIRRQDLSCVKELVVVDNNTDDDLVGIKEVIDRLEFTIPVTFDSIKHDDARRTHAWSTNKAVSLVRTPWIFFTRADYLLDFGIVKRFVDVANAKAYDHILDWNGFITSNGSHLVSVIQECESTRWRSVGPGIFHGSDFDYTSIDSGVWMAKKEVFDRVGGLDERLTAWGHSQTEFQYRMFKAGTEFVRIPEVLFWHPRHEGERDIDLAHRQLAEQGADLKAIWARYHGVSPYA